MDKLEKEEKEIEKIKAKGKYCECHIIIDNDKPEYAHSRINGKNFNLKTIYSMLMSIRNVEKQLLEKHPELNLLDLITSSESKNIPIYESEQSMSTQLAEIFKEIGRSINKKKDEDNL